MTATTRGVLGGYRARPYEGGELPDGSVLTPGISRRLLLLIEGGDWEVFRVSEPDAALVEAFCRANPIGTQCTLTFDPRKYGSQPYRALAIASL